MFKESINLERINHFLSRLFALLILLVCTSVVHAQTSKGNSASDSIKSANQHRLDSLNFLRTYKQSKHYKDSLETAREKHLDDTKADREHIADSTNTSRKRIADSVMASRKHYTDSIKDYNENFRIAQKKKIDDLREERKRVSDSMSAVRAYKLSKHYKDSVITVRALAKEKITKIRRHNTDSLRTMQKTRTDSTLAVRKTYNDSMKASIAKDREVRMHALDSLKTIRAARADSMGKVRLARAALRKQKAEEKEKGRIDKLKLKFEIKIKKQQDAYTNETMRKKKWTVPRKLMQNTFTRYNYYFNANKKMEEATRNMVRSHAENYDSLISLFPFDPDRDSTKLLSDMDTIIRKTSTGIQIHDPRAKWQDDLYLLMGEAYYYKGDYQNAGACFKQIVSQAEQAKKEEEKKKGPQKNIKASTKPTNFSSPEKTGIAGALEHKSAENTAMLWLSRTLAQSRREGQAQTILDMLRNDAQFPKRLEGRLALEQAFVDLRSNNFTHVTEQLAIVTKDKELPNWLRQRASFLNAQLLQQQLHYPESDQNFKEVLALNPSLEMEFYARKNIAFNSINNGSSTLTANEMLGNMATDGKYRPYYDQIYYAMGKAALKNNKKDEALADFKKSVALSQSNRKQKGITFAALGDEYYARSDYRNAKSSYDSAAMFLTPAQDPIYSIALQRARALDKVAIPGNEVIALDSLLHLASLSEKDQRQAIRDYIKEVARRQRDSAFRAENGLNTNNNPAQSTFQNQGNQAWYFANPNLMKQGQNDFKQKWGTRPLKDNWRISSSRDNNFADAGANGTNGSNASEEDNLPNEDTLYAAIPHTPNDIKKSNEDLKEALFRLGKAYYTDLEDYGKAIGTFDTLDRRYPENTHAAEVLYTRYLMSMRKNNPTEAAQYNTELQSKYPQSDWAKLLKGATAEDDNNPYTATASNTPAKETLSNFYDDTYGQLMQRQYESVLDRIKTADDQYKNQGNFRKKFTLMKAIAIAGTGKYPEADTMLRQFVSAYPNDSLTVWANAMLEYIKKQPKPESVNGINPSDTSKASGLQYNYNPTSTHYVIIAAVQDAKFSGLRSGLSDYNLMKKGHENITVTMSTLESNLSLVICKEFANAQDAKAYMNEIKNVNLLFREFKPSDYEILLISSDNFPKLFVKKDISAYKAFYTKNYK